MWCYKCIMYVRVIEVDENKVTEIGVLNEENKHFIYLQPWGDCG